MFWNGSRIAWKVMIYAMVLCVTAAAIAAVVQGWFSRVRKQNAVTQSFAEPEIREQT